MLFPPPGGPEQNERTALSAGYVVGLLWMFMGVSALTERLMEAIAVITSKSRWQRLYQLQLGRAATPQLRLPVYISPFASVRRVVLGC